MNNLMDEVLQKNGLKYDELTIAERETLYSWIDAVKGNQVTLPKVRDWVSQMRYGVEQELTERHETPQSWLSLLGLLIPLVGIIRKWYADQRQVELKARLRSYTLLEAFLTSPERAEKNLEQAIASFASRIK